MSGNSSQLCKTMSDKSRECLVIETDLYTKYMRSRVIVLKKGQKVQQLAQCFHTSEYSAINNVQQLAIFWKFFYLSIQNCKNYVISCKDTTQ